MTGSKKNALLIKELRSSPKKTSLKLLLKTAGPSILSLLIFTLLSAIIMLIILPSLEYNYFSLEPQIDSIRELLSTNPNYELSEGELLIVKTSEIYATKIAFFNYILHLIPLMGLMLVLPGKTHNLITHNKESPDTWVKSFIEPFNTKDKAVASVFLLLFMPIILTIGMIMMYIPGILIMVYLFFSFQSLVLDEKSGMEIFRGGRFYAKGNFMKITLLLFLGIFLPSMIMVQFKPIILNTLQFTEQNHALWVDPNVGNYGTLFIYYFLSIFLENILLIWFPILHTVHFILFREQKIRELREADKNEKVDVDLDENKKTYGVVLKEKADKTDKKKIITITISSQKRRKTYTCKKCGNKIPIGSKKCSKCGQLYKIIFK